MRKTKQNLESEFDTFEISRVFIHYLIGQGDRTAHVTGHKVVSGLSIIICCKRVMNVIGKHVAKSSEAEASLF